jgi:ribonuclease HI
LKEIKIYTDGAARGNPGNGGFGAILIYGTYSKAISKGFKLTTNNRMELMAVIEALKMLKEAPMQVTIYSDSKYVVDSITLGWLQTWIKTQFKGGKKNKDLWLQYNAIAKLHNVKMVWVKGHANNELNNQCDILATTAADSKDLYDDVGYIQSLKDKDGIL